MGKEVQIGKHYWMPSIKKEWEVLEQEKGTTPFQRYSFMYSMWKTYFVYIITKRELPVFFTVIEQGECVMIAPLCIHQDGTYSLFGNINGNEYCDFLYKRNGDTQFYIGSLLKSIGNKISCGMVKKTSPLYEFWSIHNNVGLNKEVCYVNIPFEDNHSSYFKALSSSVRQNIRTAYNRLAKGDMNIAIRVVYGDGRMSSCTLLKSNYTDFENRKYSNSSIDNDEKKDYFDAMLDLYVKRHEIRYDVHTSRIKKYYLKHFSFSTLSLKSLPYAVNCMLLINNELAAFMGGYVDFNLRSCIIPRLSINESYKFYSPGLLLINEAILFFVNKTNIRNLDLGRGEESYKVNMGGVKIPVVDFDIFQNTPFFY